MGWGGGVGGREEDVKKTASVFLSRYMLSQEIHNSELPVCPKDSATFFFFFFLAIQDV